MAITAGSDILASDFITASAGAGDSGKAPKLASDGRLDHTFIRRAFGGTGADGALTISSGTTTINCSNAKVVVKNYSSIAITGTGQLAFSNPHANGTIVILKSQGNVTITSSATPGIELTGMGAAGGTGGAAATGDGGRGGGGLLIECAGALNFTGTIYAKGQNGAAGTGSGGGGGWISTGDGTAGWAIFGTGPGGGLRGSQPNNTVGTGGTAMAVTASDTIVHHGFQLFTGAGGGEGGSADSGSSGGGGGGGGGGCIVILYNTLTSASGTCTVTGGTGGGAAGGGAGAGGGGGSMTAGSNMSGTTGGAGANGMAVVSENLFYP